MSFVEVGKLCAIELLDAVVLHLNYKLLTGLFAR